MIAFASQFFGLLIGVLPVTVLVEKPVAAVVFELDGKAVGKLEAPPWTLRVDFGSELLPHDLAAHAFDGEGHEIGTARQFVNLPRPPAEVEVLLERDERGDAVAARFAGQSFLSSQPRRATVTLDGRPIPASSGEVKLPPYDPQTRHVLSVELEFTPSVRSRADVAFGAGETSLAQSELTALAVNAKQQRKFPEGSALAGAFLHGGRALNVVAVERGPALVEIVRNPSALRSGRSFGEITAWLRSLTSLASDDRVRFMWPVPRPIPGASGRFLFDWAGDFSGSEDESLHQLLTHIEYAGPEPRELRFADATGAAGLDATASGSRRAVVLVLGGESADSSRDSPAAVRHYLQAIQVPLFVWSLNRPEAEPLAKGWGTVIDTSSGSRLVDGVAELKRVIESQRIVWVQGRFLPQDVALSPAATDIEFAR